MQAKWSVKSFHSRYVLIQVVKILSLLAGAAGFDAKPDLML